MEACIIIISYFKWVPGGNFPLRPFILPAFFCHNIRYCLFCCYPLIWTIIILRNPQFPINFRRYPKYFFTNNLTYLDYCTFLNSSLQFPKVTRIYLKKVKANAKQKRKNGFIYSVRIFLSRGQTGYFTAFFLLPENLSKTVRMFGKLAKTRLAIAKFLIPRSFHSIKNFNLVSMFDFWILKFLCILIWNMWPNWFEEFFSGHSIRLTLTD